MELTMLWKKESNEPGALYVNIFAHRGESNWNNCYENDLRADRSVPSKSNTSAVATRKIGNMFFGGGEWCDAVRVYGDSLCVAEKGSEHISLAYANRSACFFHSKMYNECLVDIELAKAAGYPERLMPKLDRRKAECLKCIEDEGAAASDDFGLKLSYDPDEKCPYQANVLKFERNDNGEYGIYAKEDIDVGKTIVVETAFSTYLFKQYGWRCNICLKTNTNLVPCENCAMAAFCKDTCTGHYLHEFECGLKLGKAKKTTGLVMHEVRVILMVINMFESAGELIEFVEQTIASDRNELPESLLDEKSKYQTFLKLPSSSTANPDVVTIITYGAYKMLLDIQKVQSMFQIEKHRRFLIHLIAWHCLISVRNGIGTPTKGRCSDDCEIVCTQTRIQSCFVKHSCAPKVLLKDHEDKIICITVRPVKKGEQISSFSKIGQKECSSCGKEAATQQQRRLLDEDPDYLGILSESRIEDNEKKKQLMEKCVAFLNRHGRIEWCPELEAIVHIYSYLLCIRFDGPMGTGTLHDGS